MTKNFTSKRNWLLSTAAVALIISGQAVAQEDGDEAAAVTEAEDETATLQTVRVTGIRSSIQNSLATKRNETSIVEAISAEDIGKLPDLSIADSLAFRVSLPSGFAADPSRFPSAASARISRWPSGMAGKWFPPATTVAWNSTSSRLN